MDTTYDVFLSYNTHDHQAAEAIARHLEKSGLLVFFDRWYLAAGIPWPQRLEEILGSCRAVAILLGPSGMGNWQQREKGLALDRQSRHPTFPVIPVLLPGADPALGFLALNTWVDLRQGIHDIPLAFLLSAIRGTPPGPDLPSRTAALAGICPYRGLRYFREEDAPFFFGRDAFVKRLATAIDQHSLVAVVGPSGSGKSSVVRAGLLPHLRRRDGKHVWDVATMVPGASPLENLAAVMVPVLEPNMTEVDRLAEIGKLAKAFARREISLRSTVMRALEKQPGTDRFMLVVDQWEELYTQTSDDEDRKIFLDEVLEATTSDVLSVVLNLRGDFYGQAIDYRPFSDRLGEPVNISPMTREELAQVIEGPAAKVGLQFELGLVGRLLDKVEGQPGNLPLLEFVLMELWKACRNGPLTHAAYEQLGEIQGAIAKYAEAFFGELTQTEQDITRRIFLQLVRPGEKAASESPDSGAKHTRRRASFAELGEGSLPVVRKLADAHLLVTGRSEATGEETVDLVHEALIKAWERLSKWIDDDLKFLRWRERLRTLIAISPGHQEKNTLLRGDLLLEARAWLRARRADLSSTEQAYIERSIKAKNWQVARQLASGMALVALLAIAFLSAQRGPLTPVRPGDQDNQDEPDAPTVTGSEGVKPPVDPLPPVEGLRVPSEAVTIPVVVHVVFRDEAGNISDEQIRSQIDVLNKDYRARNEGIVKVPVVFQKDIGDARIEFALATTDPQGKPTNGITRNRTTNDPFKPDDSMKLGSRGGADAWPAERYLNIWVCDLNGLVGYATYPGMDAARDGVVIDYEAWGTVGTAKEPLNLGRPATHEIGHYLGLYHLWGDRTDCQGTDFVEDTPPQEGPNYAKPVFPHISCDNGPRGDMFMNFMDNTDDDSTHMFTKGQVLRMHQTLQGARKGLATSRGSRDGKGSVKGRSVT